MAAPAPEQLPVALFAYNRPQLLARTLECLRAAGFHRLYVFSDGPREDVDRARIAEVRALAAAVRWADVTTVASEGNLGLSESMRRGLGWLFEREERAVVIEDDIRVAPEFGRFAAAVLDAYADEERVAGVTGLRLPFSRRPLRQYPFDACMLPRFFSWGWATWRRAWGSFDIEADSILERLRARGDVRLEAGGADLPYMVRRAVVERTLSGSWDVLVAASMILEGQLFVVPVWNMVENEGFAAGTHPQSPRWRLGWEASERRDVDALRLPPPELDPRILKAYHVFRENPQGWTPRRLVPRQARMLLRRLRGTYDVLR